MYKKLLTIFLALMMALAFTACGGGDSGEDTSSDQGAGTEESGDGITNEVFQPTDEQLFIRFTNNTGGDIVRARHK